MKLEEIFSSYALNDGETLSFNLNFIDQTCAVKLKVRRHLRKQQFQECAIDLQFIDVLTIDISEDFRTTGGFSDITFTKTAEGKFYLSLDPYGNTGQPNERDNFVITSSSLIITYESGEKFQVS
jgi:hypothetical protein